MFNGQPPAHAGSGFAGEPGPSPPSALDNLLAIKIYRVNNGTMTSRTFTRDALEEMKSLDVPGYVSGIVAVGKPGTEIRVAGKPMTPVRENENDKYSMGYYGTIDTTRICESTDVEVFSFFPLVPADTVNGNSRFALKISSGQASPHFLQISHKGAKNGSSDHSSNIRAFQYVGFPEKDLSRITKDTDNRLGAISAGIAAVERYFQADLVNSVNLINYDDIYNAVTYLNHNDIWFYISTFENETANELKIITQHEALHILVDQLELTANPEIRELFAELKGFNDLSMERHQVLRYGRTPRSARLDKGEGGYFFEFISENNFLDGMNGGHPEENLDEFCTSFLHTLMYPERFKANLMTGGGNLRIDDEETRETILRHYANMLRIVIAEMESSASSGLDVQTVSDRFRQQLGMLKNVDIALVDRKKL